MSKNEDLDEINQLKFDLMDFLDKGEHSRKTVVSALLILTIGAIDGETIEFEMDGKDYKLEEIKPEKTES